MFESLESVVAAMKAHGVIRLLVKPLAENDNSKQQIYLQTGTFEVLNQLPYKDLETVTKGKTPTIHAALRFSWLSSDGGLEPAKHAKLILYPKYPEIRLSGFLLGCKSAPSEQLQPVPKESRLYNNGPDGRFLLLGITGSDTDAIIAVLAPGQSSLSLDILARISSGDAKPTGVFWEFEVPGGTITALEELLALLADIRAKGPHAGLKLGKGGVKPYRARNAGGYTLEALLGIRANGKSEPDFKGWEVKSFGGGRITLMTPEPDGGVYVHKGLEEFLRTYGYEKDDRLNFTGSHKVGLRHAKSKLTLVLKGFDSKDGKITDVDGGLMLNDGDGHCAASWSFRGLMEHWGRKHNQAIYVPSRNVDEKYSYLSPAILGEGTDFKLFLAALGAHRAIYDPGSWFQETPKRDQKKRNQFRVYKTQLKSLYKSLRTQAF